MLRDNKWFKKQGSKREPESGKRNQRVPPRIADVPRIYDVARVLWQIAPSKLAATVGEMTAVKARLLIIVIADAVDHRNGWTFIREATIGSRIGLCGKEESNARGVRRTLGRLVEHGIVVEWKRGRRVYRRVDLSVLNQLAEGSGISQQPNNTIVVETDCGVESPKEEDSTERATGVTGPPITSREHSQNTTTPITDGFEEVGCRLVDLGVAIADRVVNELRNVNADLDEINGAIDHFLKVRESAGFKIGALVYRLKPQNLGQPPSEGFPAMSEAAQGAVRKFEKRKQEELYRILDRDLGHLLLPGAESLAYLIKKLELQNPSLAFIARESTVHGSSITCEATRRALLKIADEERRGAA